jgi:hypothetical protein
LIFFSPFLVLGIKSRSSHMLSRCSTTELCLVTLLPIPEFVTSCTGHLENSASLSYIGLLSTDISLIDITLSHSWTSVSSTFIIRKSVCHSRWRIQVFQNNNLHMEAHILSLEFFSGSDMLTSSFIFKKMYQIPSLNALSLSVQLWIVFRENRASSALTQLPSPGRQPQSLELRFLKAHHCSLKVENWHVSLGLFVFRTFCFLRTLCKLLASTWAKVPSSSVLFLASTQHNIRGSNWAAEKEVWLVAFCLERNLWCQSESTELAKSSLFKETPDVTFVP